MALCQLMLMAALQLEEALDLLHFCLSQDGGVKWGPHFLQELEDEKLTFPDAWHVLRKGRILKPPEHNVKTGEWKYSVEGYEPDGKWIVIVFCFKATDLAFLITIFSVGGSGG